MGIISINGLKIFAHHGVLPQERRVGNMFVVDIRLNVPKSEVAQQTDHLDDTLNYAEVVALVQREMTQPHQLLERVAGAIIAAIQEKFGGWISQGEVKISKLAPPISAELESVSYTASFG